MILQFQRRWTGCNHHSHDNLQQDLADRRMANPVNPVLIHHTSQERQPAAVPGLPGLISHPSKVVLKIILNRLKPQAKKVIAEEQAGFRASRSTTEQIFNLRILREKCLHRLQEGLEDRVWHVALRATMKKYNIIANLIRVIKTSVTRPLVPSSSTAAYETGSGQQLESDRDVYSHPPSSTYLWKGSLQTP